MQAANVLSVTTVVARKSAIPEAEIDNEVVMLDPDKGVYLSLNKVGTRIWQLIDGRATVGDICKTLGAEYSVDAATCERQVIDLLDRMRKEGLIEVRG